MTEIVISAIIGTIIGNALWALVSPRAPQAYRRITVWWYWLRNKNRDIF